MNSDKSMYRISGYASLFGRIDQATDLVQRGAFSSAIKRRQPIRMLYQHNAEQPIGRWTKIEETNLGLWVEGELAVGARQAQDVAHLISTGAIDGLSIGYRVRRALPGNGRIRRYLQEIDLLEISIVTFPMQTQARIHHWGGAVRPRKHVRTLSGSGLHDQ